MIIDRHLIRVGESANSTFLGGRRRDIHEVIEAETFGLGFIPQQAEHMEGRVSADVAGRDRKREENREPRKKKKTQSQRVVATTTARSRNGETERRKTETTRVERERERKKRTREEEGKKK
jgi:hypothetical protein